MHEFSCCRLRPMCPESVRPWIGLNPSPQRHWPSGGTARWTRSARKAGPVGRGLALCLIAVAPQRGCRIIYWTAGKEDSWHDPQNARLPSLLSNPRAETQTLALCAVHATSTMRACIYGGSREQKHGRDPAITFRDFGRNNERSVTKCRPRLNASQFRPLATSTSPSSLI